MVLIYHIFIGPFWYSLRILHISGTRAINVNAICMLYNDDSIEQLSLLVRQLVSSLSIMASPNV